MSSQKLRYRKLPDRSTVGGRIRVARGKKTQAELGSAIGQPKSVISLWETGARTPSAEHLGQIAQATGYGLGWLLHGDEVLPPAVVAEGRPAYGSPDLAELVAGIQEILDSGVEVVIRALRANIEAFRLSARELREKKGAGVRRERKEGPSGRSGSGQGGD